MGISRRTYSRSRSASTKVLSSLGRLKEGRPVSAVGIVNGRGQLSLCQCVVLSGHIGVELKSKAQHLLATVGRRDHREQSMTLTLSVQERSCGFNCKSPACYIWFLCVHLERPHDGSLTRRVDTVEG